MRPLGSSAPKALEAGRGQLCIAHSVLDVLVPEVGLECAGIVLLVGQCESAGVPQHVGVCLEPKVCLCARKLDQAGKTPAVPYRRAVATTCTGASNRPRSQILFVFSASQICREVAEACKMESLGFRMCMFNAHSSPLQIDLTLVT